MWQSTVSTWRKKKSLWPSDIDVKAMTWTLFTPQSAIYHIHAIFLRCSLPIENPAKLSQKKKHLKRAEKRQKWVETWHPPFCQHPRNMKLGKINLCEAEKSKEGGSAAPSLLSTVETRHTLPLPRVMKGDSWRSSQQLFLGDELINGPIYNTAYFGLLSCFCSYHFINTQ